MRVSRMNFGPANDDVGGVADRHAHTTGCRRIAPLLGAPASVAVESTLPVTRVYISLRDKKSREDRILRGDSLMVLWRYSGAPRRT